MKRVLILFLAMGICSNLCASGLQLFQDRAGKFWEFEDRSKVIMRSIANWLQRHPDIEKITPETSLEIKQIIESYYDFATALNGFLGEQERAFINSTATHKFEDLYDEKIGEEVVTDVHLHEALFGALGDLLLFENLRFQFKVVSASDMFKEKLNEIEAGGQQGHYSRLVENLMSRAKRLRFSNTLEFLDDHSEKLDTLQGEGFLYLQALRQRLETHLAQDIRDSATFWGRIKGHFKKYFTKFDIRQHKRLNWTEYYLSKVFGNLAGSINVQKLIKSIPVEELQRVKAEVLQPGDVIVEKTTGAITDKFIPGHFGHVAVYIGRPEQLKGILLSDGSALLDHPKVKALIPELEAGATTMEAIRPGTRLEDISHWAITDLAVLRPQSYPKKHLGDVLLKAMSYSGTKYDFNFDVNTEAIVVCSELPYQTFRGINFRIAYKAGRWTISPDDVAILAGPDDSDVANRPLRLVYFNHETKEVEQAERFELYKTLVDVDSNYADAPENDHSYPELQ